MKGETEGGSLSPSRETASGARLDVEGERKGGTAVCGLYMRAESPTGFKTIRHPGSRQMCSTARDKTRDDESSFVKPFSGWNGAARRQERGGLCSKPMKSPVKDTSFCIPSFSHYSRGIRVAKDIPPRGPFRKVSKGIPPETSRVGRIRFAERLSSDGKKFRGLLLAI